jgi:hypothetical protein
MIGLLGRRPSVCCREEVMFPTVELSICLSHILTLYIACFAENGMICPSRHYRYERGMYEITLLAISLGYENRVHVCKRTFRANSIKRALTFASNLFVSALPRPLSHLKILY